jgi:hypothetical protein
MEVPHLPGGPPEIHFPVNRIVMLVLLLLVIGGSIFIAYFKGISSKSDKLTEAEKAPQEKDDFAPPILPDEPIQLPPDLATQVKDADSLDRSKVEEAPYRDLMSKVLNREGRFLREVLKYREADHDTLVQEPEKHRGETYFVRGEMVDFNEFMLDKPFGDFNRIHFGVVKDNQNNLFWFETLAFDDENIFKVGQIIIAEGVFFKNYKYIHTATAKRTLKDLPEQQDNLPMLICKSVRRSFRISEVTTLDKRLVRSAAWKMLPDQEVLETRPLYHLLGYIDNLPKDKVPKKIKTYDDMAGRLLVDTKLDKYRGEWVEFWGKLCPIYKHLDDENPAGIKQHYRAYVSTSDRTFVAVFLTEKPRGFKPFKDIVKVRGIFFKPWVYESDRPDGQPVRVPLVVAKSLIKMEFKASIWTTVSMVLMALLLVAVFGMAWVIYRERRQIKQHHEAFLKRRRERRLKKIAEGTGGDS